MKKLFLLFLAFLTLNVFALEWCSSYRSAKKKATRENKRILIFFTGSDWCSAGETPIRQYFGTPEFRKMAAEKLILYNADLPKYKKLGQEADEYNRRLVHRYSVISFPAIVVVNPGGGGMLLKQVGGGKKELAVFADKLERIVYGSGKGKKKK